MKKFLFAALAVLMLTAVCIVGMFTVLSQDGTVAAAVDELDAVGAGAVAVTAGACDDGAHDYSVVTPIEEGDYANYYHQSVCSLCGAVAPGVPVPHSFGVWKYDDTAHWLECACGVKQSDIFPTITPVAHDTYIDTDDWHTDGDNHWNECVCGYKANLEAHIGGSATCLEEATCTTCDASYGGVNGGVHVDGGYWEQTETTHQGIYKCCGLVVDVTDHVWGEDHICDICEYECQHTGGEATCVAVAICDWCGKGYGQINPDNHHGGTATCVAEAECTDCGQPYGEKNLENHTSPDFYYEVNGTDATKHDKKHTCCNQVAETVGHTGGTATCNTLAVCEHCGTSYGSYNETNHAEGYTITWTVTVTTHTGDYSCCDAIVAETEHDWNGDSTCDTCEYVCANHVGGTATCKTLAVCDYCDMSYGELDADNHESAEYNYAAIINNDSSTTQHSRTHQCCNAPAENEDHTVGEAANCQSGAICEYCEAEYTAKDMTVHTEATFTYEVIPGEAGALSTQHKKIHTCCGEFVAEDHTGGEAANCQTGSICAYCQTVYTAKDMTVHTEATFRYEVIPGEGGALSTQHKKIHTCCGEFVPEDHTVGEAANCQSGAICEHCEAEYTAKDMTVHTEATFRYEVIPGEGGALSTQHKKIHTCCGEFVPEDHTVGEAANCQSGAICEHCEAEYTAKDMTVHTEATFRYEVIPGEGGALSTQHRKIHTCCGEFVAEVHTGGVANCQSGARCEYCQEVYTGLNATKHTSTEYTYTFLLNSDNTTTQHTKNYQCCGVVAATEDHTVGEAANCQSGAICEYCETEYTAKDMTNHTEATFRYEAIAGGAGALSTQHKKIHTCCGEFVPEDHTVGEAANCQSGAICEYCEAEYTAKDMTVHTEATFRYEVIPGEGGALSTQHKKIHTCCGEFVPEVHTGGVANCQSGARCEYCQEVYTGLNATKHTSTEYTYAPLLNSDNTTTQHTKNYQCCGVVAATESHSGGIANCLEKAVCTNCGTAYGSKDETVHKTPDAFEYAITETQHTKLYACCDAPAAETEDHDFVNGSCSVCDAACAHTDGQFAYTVNADDENQHDKFYQCCGLVVETVSHAFGEDLYNQDSAQHWYLCVCGATNGAEDHAWELKPVANDPDHHHMICTCGNVQADSTAEHTFDAYDKNGTFHWSICACGESAPDAQDIAHVYDLHKHDDENHWSECICGQIDAGSVVAHVLVKDWDEGSHWDSCEDANCNYTANAEEHIYSNLAAGKDAQGHWDECDCGAPNPLSLAEHEWEDGACEICQYTCVHGTADDHEFCVNADDNSKHDEICMLCREVLNTVDHDFTGDVYVSDGEHHWIACADCLVKEDPEAGEAHDTTSEATCNSQAVCSVCGEYGDFDGDNHATEDVKFMPIPGDLKQHAQLHACCDVLIQKMDHTYEDGVCTTEGCEYTCTHTGGTATCKDKAVCTACGEAYGELATEHKYDNACDTKCNVCDAEREITHSYGEWTVTKEATETEAGEKKRTCSICGATQTEEIAALGKQGLGTGAIVGIVAGSVVVVGAGVGIGVAAAKRGAAAKKAAADQKPWRTKKNKKSKWKKK